MDTHRCLRYSKTKAKHFPPLILVYFSHPRLAIKVEVAQVALTQCRQKSCNTAAVKGKLADRTRSYNPPCQYIHMIQEPQYSPRLLLDTLLHCK